MRKLFDGIQFSSVYKTNALEYKDQDGFLNAVAVFQSKWTPEEIYEKLHQIETDLGKDPPIRFGPRTIDLDILLYDDLVYRSANVKIPHPRMHSRRFVLEPLSEVWDPSRALPEAKKSILDLLEEISDQTCEKIDMTL